MSQFCNNKFEIQNWSSKKKKDIFCSNGNATKKRMKMFIKSIINTYKTRPEKSAETFREQKFNGKCVPKVSDDFFNSKELFVLLLWIVQVIKFD